MQIELWRIITSVVFGLAAVAVAVIAVLSWLCKGPLLSQAWTLGTPEQREKLNKKDEYRSVATVMTGLFVAFVLLAFYVVFEGTRNVEWMFYLALVAAVVAVFLGMFGGAKKIAAKFRPQPQERSLPEENDKP